VNYEQLFVGGTAILLGALSIVAGASNRDVFFQSTKIKWIETLGGRPLARAIYALIGVSLVGLGVAIAMGFAPNSSAAPN
jgi:hypothetical protein